MFTFSLLIYTIALKREWGGGGGLRVSLLEVYLLLTPRTYNMHYLSPIPPSFPLNIKRGSFLIPPCLCTWFKKKRGERKVCIFAFSWKVSIIYVHTPYYWCSDTIKRRKCGKAHKERGLCVQKLPFPFLRDY